MNGSDLTKQDFTLLTLYLAGSRGLSPVQLQKVLFILGKELGAEIELDFYAFTPYNYGPFCKEIYQHAEQLSMKGLVQITHSPERRWGIYEITHEGKSSIQENLIKFHENVVDYLTQVVKWAQALSFRDLVQEIYNKYPEYRINSVFQG